MFEEKVFSALAAYQKIGPMGGIAQQAGFRSI